MTVSVGSVVEGARDDSAGVGVGGAAGVDEMGVVSTGVDVLSACWTGVGVPAGVLFGVEADGAVGMTG